MDRPDSDRTNTSNDSSIPSRSSRSSSKPFTPRTLTLSLVTVVLVIFLLSRITDIWKIFGQFLAVAMPLIQGMAFAYLLNLPMRSIERSLERWLGKRRPSRGAGHGAGRDRSHGAGHPAGRDRNNGAGHPAGRWLRPISLLLTLLMVVLVIVAVLALVVPQVVSSMTDLSGRLPGLLQDAQAWINQQTANQPWLNELALSLQVSSTDLLSWSLTVLQNSGAGWLNSTFNWLASAFGWLVSLILSLIFAIYLLLAKEKLQSQLQRLLAVALPARANQNIRSFFQLSHQMFSHFFAGQFIEAVILGVIFLVVLLIFQFPYAFLIAVLIALTALIPMAGAYIALVVGAFLILLINPWQALAFVILFLVIQQLENNLIYPRVVGSSIGLPALWVLAAIVIGGGLFGVLGMILLIPLTAIAYNLIQQWVKSREKNRIAVKKTDDSTAHQANGSPKVSIPKEN